MRVTTVIPARNPCRKRLDMSARSAREAGSDEVIVVDDGSDAPVGSIHATRVLRRDHEGIAGALNAGFQAAEGTFVCWLSVGDVMDPGKILRQHALMARVGAAASFTEYRSQKRPPNLARLTSDNQFCGSTVMIHRGIALLYPLDTSLRYCVDWDWACRVQFEGTGWLHIPEKLGDAHEYDDGHTKTADPKARARDRAEVARRWRRYAVPG